ncbi:gliding motility-associated C-terminal domain-containing protein [Flavobacterium wongokense]|uniref:T9SS type B sorting domain-containing protein n=1 Tax=Flavobacterium wongokense TaxID=2910674 RepID=UPI001F42D894|nr:gliding motility-associated C-terminal domain-containing protein [Flavobacterium sp. WG47]MCF6133114.1 gliding motility-associated C-terminal domain-containing protein [Flavobacterium sp. WG47]
MKKLYLVIFLFLCVGQATYGQLSNFVLTLTKTDESCTGNASLTFNVTNTTPGSTFIYRIYRLPDVVNSIAVTSANTFGGLTSGTYRVVATQTLGAASGTQQQDITILDTRVYITYSLSHTAINCDTGTINVNVLTGNPVSYEIISGPITVPPQASNSFPNLPAGTYNVRVNDNCGEGVVQTYTVTFYNPLNLNIGPPSTPCELESCNTIEVSHNIASDPTTTIRYPLTIQITVFPPSGGTPIILTQTLTSGNPTLQGISNIIPFYHAQGYSYNIRVTDACGNVYVRNNNQINLQLQAVVQPTYINCLKVISIGLCNYVPPFTVNFLSAPPGFNPTTYNSGHPGPFAGGGTNYYSITGNQIPNGNYTVQVTDGCGRSVTRQIVMHDFGPGYIFKLANPCDIFESVQIPADENFGPFITSAIITASTNDLGHPIPYNVTGLISGGVLQMQLPPGTYTIQGMDTCGNPFSYTFEMPPKPEAVIVNSTPEAGCAGLHLGNIKITGTITSAIITSAPTGYNHPMPYDVSFLIPTTVGSTMTIPDLITGDYGLDITDICGIHHIMVVNVGHTISQDPLLFFEMKGCGENYDSIALVTPNDILTIVRIIAAPPSFPHPLPYDVSFNIGGDGQFYMNSFPEGSYTFYTKDICDVEKTTTYNLIGYHQGVDGIDVITNCGSFDVNMNFTDNIIPTQLPSYWLQRLDPVTNQWGHPLTGVAYPLGSVPNASNSFSLSNPAMNYNIAATGTFRILIKYNYFGNGYSSENCVHTIKTFIHSGDLEIINAYGIPCVNGGSQVYIIANGAAPLNYRITSWNGVSFIVNNGTSNSFAGLQPGIYNFRVQDVCGNVVNRLFDINTLQQPEITPNNLCQGQNGQLSVQPFSFLNYEWWKDNDTATILSTTNTLNFTPFTNANIGVYHVRIYSTTTNSCVDRILNYTIAPSVPPNAGIDANRTICSNASTVNLFTILGTPFDTGGDWEEITSSGMLVGSNWLSSGVPLGTYIFRYTVNGFCGAVDDATVTITLLPAPEVPVITGNTSYCIGEDIELFVQSIPNATYQWSGPDNFSSSLQNPIIADITAANAGTYSVNAIIGNCQSPASIVVTIKPAPDYTHEELCESGGAYTVRIIPAEGSSFDPNTATYLWSGPNNFTSTANPLIITNQPTGDYSVVVTNNEGCSFPQTINITSTFCDFPNVITPNNDGANDGFDLTNYDVDRLEIYSRWGRLVYEENNYTNGWYGQNMHGGYLPDSTYYYIVRLRNGVEKHGWIFVGRG